MARIAIAKTRFTIDEGPCSPEEEIDEVEPEDAPPHVVLVLLVVCGVEETLNEEFGESRTSKLNHIQSISSPFLKR